MDNKTVVFETLKKSPVPMKSGEIAVQCGIEKAEVDKVIKKLKNENLVTSPKNCYYAVK